MFQKKISRRCTRSPGSRAMPLPQSPICAVNLLALRFLKATLFACLLLPAFSFAQPANATDSLSILFLGTSGRHQPAMRAQEFIPAMAARGIGITYTANLGDLNAATLARYDGLLVYGDSVKFEPALENAILDYIAGGKGFIAIHGAIDFLRSPKYKALIGAEFKYHSTGRFSTSMSNTDHPILKDLHEFETWDETYVHTTPSQDCTVLLMRREGERDEPWTWVRNHGQGRVFYTAYGHDKRTWTNPGFQLLVERGIRWSCGGSTM